MRRIVSILLGVPLLWSLCHRAVYWGKEFFLPRDNFEVSFPLFRYGIDYVKAFSAIPSWVFGLDGGVWFEPLANNYLLFLPHRFVGLLMGLLGVDANIAYKGSLFIGVVLFLFGVYWLATELEFSRVEALMIATSSYFSSLGMGGLHQEQALATVFFVPFIGVGIVKARGDSRWWVWVAAIFGWSCNVHYPQITVLFWFGVGLAWAIHWIVVRRIRPSFRISGVCALAALAVLCLTISPVIYSYVSFRDRIAAPDRGMVPVESQSIQEYEKANRLTASSLLPRHLLFYLGFSPIENTELGDLDENNLFAGVGVLLAIICLCFIPVVGKWFWSVLIIWLAFLSVGIHSPLAGILYSIPGMSIFRQWYHFTSLFNLILVMMTAYSLKAFLYLKVLEKKQSILIVGSAILIAILGIAFHGNVYVWLGTSVLLMAKVYFGADSSKGAWGAIPLLSQGLLLWGLVGGMVWSHTAIKNVGKYRRWDQVMKGPDERALPFPYVGRYGQWKRLVSPKTLDGKSAIELNRLSPLYWLSENESLSAMSPSEVVVNNGWGGLDITVNKVPHKGINRILVGQAWDPGWRWRTASGVDLSVQEGPFGLLAVPIVGKGYKLRHVYSVWYLWVGLMFIAVVFSIWFVRYFEAGRRSSSAQTASSLPTVFVRG